MRLLLFLLTACIAAAQTLSLTGPSTAKAGTSITLNVVSGGATATGPAAVQWTLALPAGFTASNPLLGSGASAASKNLACGTGALLCLVYGVNQNVLGNGTVASVTVTIPANASGQTAFALSGLVAADKDGGAMPISGNPFSVSVFGKTDINNDGVTNATDVQLMVQQVLTAVCTDDQNGDGTCNVRDVQLIAVRALGL